MLRDLLAIVETGTFADLGRMDLLEAKWSGADLTLYFDVSPNGKRHETWVLVCTSAVEYHLTAANECGLNHWTSDDHPAIAQFTEPHEDLYFSRPTDNAHALLGKLNLTHRKATDDWISFDRYLNEQVTRSELVTLDGGLLASGPSFLIEAYAGVLSQEGMEPKRLASEFTEYLTQAEMIHFGDSYVVADSFDASALH